LASFVNNGMIYVFYSDRTFYSQNQLQQRTRNLIATVGVLSHERC